MKYPNKPQDISEEDWRENYLKEMVKKKEDNANHSATQIRLYKIVKLVKMGLVILGSIITAILYYIDPQILVILITIIALIYLFIVRDVEDD